MAVTDPPSSSNVSAPGDDANQNVISERVNKVLEAMVEYDKDIMTALKELSNYFPQNTIKTRRNLSSQIEERSLAVNDDFLNAFRAVKVALDTIYDDVNAMNANVQLMSQQLNSTKTQTRQLLEQTTKLQNENERLTMQEDVTTALLKTFQLTEGQVNIIREGHVSVEFFDVMNKINQIHKDCRVLVSAGGQTLGFEIMEQMASYQEVAFEKLYRWAQAHCKDIDSVGSFQLVATAMSRLQDRPILFKYVVAAYCTHRRSLLVREFLEALTKGIQDDSGAMKPPLEMSADDPLIYVQTTLSFIKDAIQSHNLNALFSQCENIDLSEETRDAISQISEGVVTPLSNRIDHIIASEELPLSSLLSIMGLLETNRETLETIMGKQGGLTKGLLELEKSCMDQFFPRLNLIVKKEVNERISLPPSGLNPPSGIEALLTLLRSFLVLPPRAPLLEKIIAGILEPLLQGVNLSASRLATVDMSVYLLNCLHLMMNTVMLYEFMDDWLERLQAQCDAQMDTLTSEQASSLVANLNLTQIYSLLQDERRRDIIQPTLLTSFTSKLERYLTTPELLTLPQVECLMSISHRSQVLRRAAQVIVAIYKQLYNFVHDPNNHYTAPETLLPRSPENVETILKRYGQQPGHSQEEIV